MSDQAPVSEIVNLQNHRFNKSFFQSSMFTTISFSPVFRF